MAERLTVTPFPKDIRAIAEYLLKYANAKSAADASHTCGLLYLLTYYPNNRNYPVSIDRVLGLAVEELQGIVRNPNGVLLLIKYEDDQNDVLPIKYEDDPNGVLLRIKHEDDPNGVLMLIKHEDDPNGVLMQIKHENGDDTEEDGEVSEP